MTILKLSKSGKAVIIIDDQGNVFITPAGRIENLLAKKAKIVMTSRFPMKASSSRFKPSELYDPSGIHGRLKNSDKMSGDAFSGKTQKIIQDIKNYKDKDVWG